MISIKNRAICKRDNINYGKYSYVYTKEQEQEKEKEKEKEKESKREQEKRREHAYSLTPNMMDPSTSSPTNTFMIKLYKRMKSHTELAVEIKEDKRESV